MGKINLRSSVKGAVMGAAMTGGWLLADLLLPEPWGDVVLFGAMAVLNIGIGWKIGRMFEQRETQEAGTHSEAAHANSPASLESQ
ncbi:hypothetical protein [Paenibacillus sp. PSB04]|uniref:hypothetical protein n=1 Tax=Paenibacillus sp. PSB04 TaxID=2866810 RepID=UPI0021F1B30C|nr:hypothetical protein [Paenibacillus sp. PSB04]UYO06259.1 hypothetical protein K2F33_10410 [Paenibacillus sp. PSB04]